ncbi:hypothetical protein ACFXGA_00825 [Actinosynnema sp. NPDC059335]|uniref:hypothetical protein n=1 Tax=Actinosynnema sp. NPDC059335 TaxID=3346804 RepID=UPI0036719FF9
MLGLLATAVLLAAGVVWYVRQGPVVKIEVAADSDELVVTPAFRDTMGNYATTLPIGQVPAPPDRQDRCAGRHRWAHSPPINGVDAGSSVAKVDITALSEDLKIDRAVLDVRTPEGDPPTMVLLACPGRGGPKPPHLLVADLDTGELLFFPDGDDEPDNFDLRITAGETESIFVIGSILETHARWRLELGGDSGETRIEYTIGPDGAREGRAAANPDQRPFETIGEFLTTPYRFRDGAWQPGR